MQKLRMYAVSFCAVNKGDLPEGPEKEHFIYWAHRGSFTLSENIEDAGKSAEAHAYRLFPKEDGYSMHSVVVSPIESEYFWRWQAAIDNGQFILDPDPNETVRTFNFDPTTTNIDLEKLKGPVH